MSPKCLLIPLTPTLSRKGELSTHLTQGVEGVIRGICMFAVNIFPVVFWIGFKRLCGQNPLFRGLNFRGGYANGWIGGLPMADSKR